MRKAYLVIFFKAGHAKNERLQKWETAMRESNISVVTDDPPTQLADSKISGPCPGVTSHGSVNETELARIARDMLWGICVVFLHHKVHLQGLSVAGTMSD